MKRREFWWYVLPWRRYRRSPYRVCRFCGEEQTLVLRDRRVRWVTALPGRRASVADYRGDCLHRRKPWPWARVAFWIGFWTFGPGVVWAAVRNVWTIIQPFVG
ncbi:hypothetical protein Bhz59_00068 [Stenotrophomonas phage vB_SmaS_Bhz59]